MLPRLDLSGLGRLLDGLAGLDGFASLTATVSVVSAVGPAVSPSASPACWAFQEPGEECVELRDPLLGNVDDDLLVLRGGSWIGLHFLLLCLLTEASIAEVFT